MENGESIALLKEIRDILVAQRDILKDQNDTYQKSLDDSRQEYADQIKQWKWHRSMSLLGGVFLLSFALAVGVSIGVVVGVRITRAWP